MTVQLNGRSHFSLGESLLKPKEIAALAAASGNTAVALTDTMSISGMTDFFTACREHQVSPIIGVRLRIVEELFQTKADKKKFRPYFLRLIVLTETGYSAMLRLLSRAFEDEHFFEVPRLLLSDVCEIMGQAGRDAAIITLGDFYGAHSAPVDAKAYALALRDAGCRVASEIVPQSTPYFTRLAHEAFALQESDGIEVIIGQPSFYQDASEAESLDLMGAISRNMPFDERSTRHNNRDWTMPDMRRLSASVLQFVNTMTQRYGRRDHWLACMVGAVKHTDAVAAEVSYDWKKQAPSLPDISDNPFGALTQACLEGWKKRFSGPVYGHTPDDLKPYKERLSYELKILKRLKFEPYFLLVAEIVNWSKENGIRVGPGRGSVGGSLVAYLMGITEVDPIRFDLLFERFINPDRIDLPDADLDFMSTRREEVFEWIKQRFGEDYVAGVSNYTTIAGAGALADVSKKIGLSNVPAFGSWIEKEHGVSLSLEKAIETSPQLAKFADENPRAMRHAQILEGTMRSFSKHAAGVVVAGVPIRERAVVERRSGSMVINWDKRTAEDFGLVKLDVLGLSNLDMIDIAIKHIWKMRGKRVDPSTIPLDDVKVLEAFGRAETTGVFQFGSSGMRKLLRSIAELGTLTFEDITAATALYRPGPMDSGLMERFVKIKQGTLKPSYPHPSMEAALENTYGVMVYQEQVMRVCVDFAGFTGVEADHLRKIMGKKDKDKMPKWKQTFIDGAVNTHGVEPDFAAEIFDQIAAFAGYGFNKSHATAYALISYICMYLKVYHPTEWFCGMLTMEKEDKRPQTLADMRRLNIALMPPDINQSSGVFEPLHGAAILAPFNSVKMISDLTQEAILKAREDGKFADKADFIERVERRRCNVRHQDNLDKVGAFATIEPGQEPADHHSRRRDQMELMPGLIDAAVIVDRPMAITASVARDLVEAIDGYRACDKCELAGLCHPKPRAEGPPQFMIVVDGPNFKEESADTLGVGSAADAIALALSRINLSLDDVYLTSLVKSPKPQGEKSWSNKTLGECHVWLDKEIEVLKPPLILALGPLAAKHLVKDMKGAFGDHQGRVIYDKTRDANILVGINPNRIYFDPSQQNALDEIVEKVVDLLPQ